jgi:eukaryotic-like serine/threonine-protein kinase
MDHAAPRHPSPESLAAFVRGTLAPKARAKVERHVADCSRCCDVLRTVPDDSLISLLRMADADRGDRGGTGQTTEVDLPGTAEGIRIPRELADHPRYRIVGLIGAGGMGVVYRAEHRLMQRQVALKVLSRHLSRRIAATERSRNEMKAAARLSHPNIVTAHDADQAGDFQFLVMEFVEGTSLARVVEKHGPLPVAHACNYARQAAQGLQHAFERGMVHRDIKPQNLMLTRPGQVKILDFGLARFKWELDPEGGETPVGSSAGVTADGEVLGTPDYIAPEQVSNSRRADVRSDIYSLGCTLYYLLSGRVPYPGGSVAQKLVSHLHVAPKALGELRDDVPPALVEVLSRMMEKDPSRRYQTPAEVAAALAPFAKPGVPPATIVAPEVVPETISSIQLAPETGPTTPPARRRLRPLPAVAAGTAAIALGVMLLASLDAPRGPRPPQGPAAADRTTPPAAGAPARPGPIALPVQRDETPAPVLPAAAGQPRRVLIVAPSRYWFLDYDRVRGVLEGGGIGVSVASTGLGPASPDGPGGGGPLTPDLLLRDARPDRFDAVVFIGGSVEELIGPSPGGRDARAIIEGMLREGKYVCSLCKGTNVLAAAGALRGHDAAKSHYIRQEYRNPQVAHWVMDEPFVASDLILTGGDFTVAEDFARGLLQTLDRGR